MLSTSSWQHTKKPAEVSSQGCRWMSLQPASSACCLHCGTKFRLTSFKALFRLPLRCLLRNLSRLKLRCSRFELIIHGDSIIVSTGKCSTENFNGKCFSVVEFLCRCADVDADVNFLPVAEAKFGSFDSGAPPVSGGVDKTISL